VLHKDITLLIADDHRLFRRSLITLLETFPRIKKVFEASHGMEVFSVVGNHSIDLVLLDLQMPIMNGEQTCAKLIREYPQVRILVVSMFCDKRQVETMLRLGAHGYINKDTDPDELEVAIIQ
jgi:DNA-binding NarL/FixJ family response regulator